ncbi:MAG TPA: ABC transporter permease [Acidimicrobiales bacterium]|nr:ABC transporter permease [Acidimicrobiales bacterium]
MNETRSMDSRRPTLTAGRVARELATIMVKLAVSLTMISLVVFILTALPGSPARDILGMYALPSQIAAFNRAHGLDAPVMTRYWHWLDGIFHGNWGTSYESNGPVWALIEPALKHSLVLVVVSWAVAVVVGVPLGLFAGARLRGRRDTALSVATVTLAALPEFTVALVLIIVVAVELRWLPVDSTALDDAGVFSSPSAYVLPAATIALAIIPYLVRLTRANAREVVSEPFVRSAVLRGITEPALTLRYVLPNAAPPVINAVGLQLAGLVGGVVVAESVFGFPGVGSLLVQAAGSRDIPVVEALVLLIGCAFVVVNVLADLVVRLVTPRLRDVAR